LLDEERLAWLALTLARTGPKRVLDAVKELDAASRIFALRLTELEGLRLPAQAAQFIFDGKARQVPGRVGTGCGARGDDFDLCCVEYPERLKEIYDRLRCFGEGSVGLLSRRPSRSWAHGTRLPMFGIGEMLARDWRCGDCWLLAAWRGASTLVPQGSPGGTNATWPYGYWHRRGLSQGKQETAENILATVGPL